MSDREEEDVPVRLPRAKFLSKNQRKRSSSKYVGDDKVATGPQSLVKELYSKEKRNLFTTIDYLRLNSDKKPANNDSSFVSNVPQEEKMESLPKRHIRKDPPARKPVWTSKRRAQQSTKEWGPTIQGYRFVGTGGEDSMNESYNAKYKYMKHTDVYDSQTYNDGYRTTIPEEKKQSSRDINNDMYVPILSFEDDDHVTSSESKDSQFKYNEYIKRWESWHVGDDIPWPVASFSFIDVNFDSIMLFLNEKEKVKKERIRWHPDKMNLKIQSKGDVADKVTKTFQLINEIWEENYGN